MAINLVEQSAMIYVCLREGEGEGGGESCNV